MGGGGGTGSGGGVGDAGRGWRARLRRGAGAFLRHPLGQLLVFLLFLYQVKEFYPFTHVPMYSDPEASAPYLFLADAAGEPLPVRAHCGVTNPKLRKMYRNRLDDYCERRGLDRKNPPPTAVRDVADDVFAFLRERAEVRGRPLPAQLQIVHALIEPAPAPEGFRETFSTLVRSRDQR